MAEATDHESFDQSGDCTTTPAGTDSKDVTMLRSPAATPTRAAASPARAATRVHAATTARAVTVSGESVEASASTATRRILTAFIALALALTLLAVPGLTRSAEAATARLTPTTTAQYARLMLAALNTERRWHHQAPLRMNRRLTLSAHRHNLHMAAHDTMSHQLPHEVDFGTRITRAGYHWQAAGENIGWNSDTTATGLLYLERLMYGEQAPDNGHRLNILSHTYRHIGIDVYYDAAHDKMWFTQNFGRTA